MKLAPERDREPFAVPAWILVAAFWVFLGLLTATLFFLGYRAERRDLDLSYWRIAAWQVASWLVWAILTPIVVRGVRRWPVRGAFTPITVHVGLAVVLVVLRSVAAEAILRSVRPFPYSPSRPFVAALFGRLSSSFHLDLLVYCGIVGVVHALDYRRKYRERERRAATLETQLAQAQLEALSLQLQPHFLFNTLHAAAGLVRDQRNAAAVKVLAALSELLRSSLDTMKRQKVRLRHELEVLQHYLDIQHARFSDRLQVRIDAPADTMDALVPRLVLQPLVENAIQHGIGRMDAVGEVSVTARRGGGQLVLEVRDNGPGFTPDRSDPRHRGLGLANTQARLAQLYGEAQRLELLNLPERGTAARLTFPLEFEDEGDR